MSVVPVSPHVAAGGDSGTGPSPVLAEAKEQKLEWYELADPRSVRVIYDSPLHDSAKFLGIDPVEYLQELWDALNVSFTCTYPFISVSPKWRSAMSQLTCGPCMRVIHWQTVKKRAYIQVHENRLETNYPAVLCCFFPVDLVEQIPLTKLPSEWQRATRCTPYHACWFCETAGQVAEGTDKGCLGCSSNKWQFPGVADAEELGRAIAAAKRGFTEQQRLPGGAFPTRDTKGARLEPNTGAQAPPLPQQATMQ